MSVDKSIEVDGRDRVIDWIVPDCADVDPWTERYEPSRKDVDGRGVGQGWWLEGQVANALKRWGYQHIEARTWVWREEVDVVGLATPSRLDSRYTRVLVECKDWDSGRVSAADIWRLIAQAFAAGCQPVLAHTTALSPSCRRICEWWDVVTLSLWEVLYSDEMPRAGESMVDGEEVPESKKWPEVLEKVDDWRVWDKSPRYKR